MGLQVLILVVLYLFIGANSECPNGFRRHGTSCYHAIRIRATWAESRMYCHAYGSRLASVESQDENDFIVGYLRSIQYAYSPAKFWIGGNDIAEMSTWIWEGLNTKIDKNGYTNFHGGYPDNGGDDDNDEHCLEFHLNDDGDWKWNDNECRENFYPLCETEVQKPIGGDGGVIIIG